MQNANRRGRGFSLVELVIVIVIIGVIAAIAVPRISRGAKGAADAALKANLATIRNAIDLYAAEHGGDFPGQDTITTQLTTKTNDLGTDVASEEHPVIFGPYLKEFPVLPVCANKNKSTVGADGGWLYTVADGGITANCTDTELDDAGIKYNTY